MQGHSDPESVRYSSVAKPRSPYIFFYIRAAKIIRKSHPHTLHMTIIRMASKAWRTLTEDQKSPYKIFAELDLKRYANDLEKETAENGGVKLQDRPPRKVRNQIVNQYVNM